MSQHNLTYVNEKSATNQDQIPNSTTAVDKHQQQSVAAGRTTLINNKCYELDFIDNLLQAKSIAAAAAVAAATSASASTAIINPRSNPNYIHPHLVNEHYC